MSAPRPDLIILGGGLAGGLAALALAARRPDIKVTLIERGERIGGHHLWSFFDSDVDPADKALVEPLIGARWDGYEVAFPAYRRTIDQSYCTIMSEALDRAVRAALPPQAILAADVVSASPSQVTLGDGGVLDAKAILDTRGLTAPPRGLDCGWQKFCGEMLKIPRGHGIERPVVMDATVDQTEGYRFVYCLPFSATELFVEDTYYSQSPALDAALLHRRISEYAAQRGWVIDKVLRSENGVLPVVMGGDFDLFWPAEDDLARGGVRAGLFHPLTSYSLPDALRFAAWLASEAPLDATLGTATRVRARAHWRTGRFDRMLARMLFHAADPPYRYRILERFYRLPAPLIARFYAGQSSARDRFRILAGRPPVPVARALSAIVGGR